MLVKLPPILRPKVNFKLGPGQSDIVFSRRQERKLQSYSAAFSNKSPDEIRQLMISQQATRPANTTQLSKERLLHNMIAIIISVAIKEKYIKRRDRGILLKSLLTMSREESNWYQNATYGMTTDQVEGLITNPNWNGGDTAKGYFQMMPYTFSAMAKDYNDKELPFQSALESTDFWQFMRQIDRKMARVYKKIGTPYSYDYSHPISQFIPTVAFILTCLKWLSEDWTWTSGEWRPTTSATNYQSVSEFKSLAGSLLKDKGLGFELILMTYHIEGYRMKNFFADGENRKIHYPVRFERDPITYLSLEKGINFDSQMLMMSLPVTRESMIASPFSSTLFDEEERLRNKIARLKRRKERRDGRND